MRNSISSNNKLQEAIKHVITEVEKGWYPTYDEICKKFHLDLKSYNLKIRDLYGLSGKEYKREPNPFLRYLKEQRLSDIAQKLFLRLGYKIVKVSIGPSSRGGPDVIIKQGRKLIPVELKAYQKYGKIGQDRNSGYYTDEMTQLKKVIKDLQAPYGYLITSTDRKAFKNKHPRIKILFNKDIEKLLRKFNFKNELEMLYWIRNSSVSYEKTETIEATKKKILNYVKKEIEQGKYVPRREIEKIFNLTLRSYFPDMNTIYRGLNIDPYSLSHFRMGGQADKERMRAEIVKFIRKKAGAGKFPTHKEIRKKFCCLLKTYFPGGVREIYKLAGVNYQRKFASKSFEEKEFTRQRIIKYTVQKLRNGFYPGYRDIESKFHINFQHYFKCLEELYQKAGYTGHVKKTWKNSGRISA